MGLTEIPGIGPATEQKLKDVGIGTVEQLAEANGTLEIPGVSQSQLQNFIQEARELAKLTPYAEAPGLDDDDGYGHGGGTAEAYAADPYKDKPENGHGADAGEAYNPRYAGNGADAPGLLQRIREWFRGER